ncbi:alkaline phosphatase family protein [Flavobacterium granuli]|uniref:Metalloenzyme superfamily protein n=1 Tax=Flavobacterium granuli TaxID=280093 RepID=A0A1M5MYF7_9FLAO|nr:alkaline phosphatase family protein [Flavobacterium granuli]PRZ25127.1 phosphopentomutase/2,3-bisphosphoglycerate-independent phosphoglycerate mutase family metalloenzyme [Flavobacterium granuli]SHG82311.1 Metalloenzyme superfamily protein [Flavobacterium granuli]
MKKITLILFLCSVLLTHAQKAENIIIITTDGLRWQELFKGMDPSIANNKKFNQGDSTYIYNKYWSENTSERKAKLLPFIWSAIVSKGQLYGNRDYNNKVNNANPYWFSYPGYSEIMTGYADTLINSNEYKANPNVNVLEFLNKQPKLKGKVAAFGAWNAFDRILNEERSGFPVISAFDKIGGNNPSPKQQLINDMLTDSFKPFHQSECLDVFTHYAAMEELKTKKPRVLYIAYGETDEWAHSGHYRSYLDAAHQVDTWIKQIWDYIQNDPQYKNKTTLILTTDHGRGDEIKTQWTSHGSQIKGASEIWFAAMGPEINTKGEIKTEAQLYQKQIAQTIAKLMGYTFEATHPIAKEITEVLH